MFEYSCDTFVPGFIGSGPQSQRTSELTAVVMVEGAWNQAGEFRDQTWTATSPAWKF